MYNTTVKLVLSLVLMMGAYSINAQQLIRETSKSHESEKKWKIEWGLIGGVGVYNAIESDILDLMELPAIGDGTTPGKYSILYAPRPEAEVGFFGEIGKVNSIFSFQTRISYTMRAVPQPTFQAAGSTEKEYRSTYLNGVTIGGIFFFKPLKKFKVGLGIEASNFLITDKVANSEHAQYSEMHSGTVAFRTVLSYNINPRIDMNIYGAVGKNTGLDSDFDCGVENSAKPDFVSAGIMMTYRLCGKEIHVKKKYTEDKKVYKIDYSK